LKKRIAQPRIGKDGKYQSLFRKVKWSWSSSTATGIEKGLREQLKHSNSGICETINDYENYALKVLKTAGFHYNKPFNFSDSYVIDGQKYSYFSREDYKSSRELAEALEYKPTAILTGVVRSILNDPDWDMTAAGRAAEILHNCQMLRESIDQGNTENTAHHAMLLQQEIDTLSFMQYEYAARVGEKQLQAKNVAYTAKEKEKWSNRYSELKKTNPKISKRKAAEIIEGETGHDSESIRKNIN